MTSGSHKVIESMSLLPMISIVIGDKLPGKVLGKMIQRIKKFMTPYGLSTEEPDSPFYTSDGYWRGPVWAPVVMIIVDSLERIGQHHLAQQISSRFVKLVAKEGFAENFDALNGKALRDPAHTWTASVFLILAKDLDRGREKSC
jgi:glycogen debranching enzyme